MRLFADTFRSSIALDASTIGDTTVTVAVSATRNDELDVLDSLCRHADRVESTTVAGDGDGRTVLGGFEPFATKSRDLDRNADRRFFECVIAEHRSRIRGLRHVHRGNPSTHDIEAIHSAILVNDILSRWHEHPLVLLDGDETKGISLRKALDGLGVVAPGLTHCVRAELYYPHSLLADLVAHYVAGLIETGTDSFQNPLVRTPHAKQTRTNEWGERTVDSKRSNPRIRRQSTGPGREPRQPSELAAGSTVPCRLEATTVLRSSTR